MKKTFPNRTALEKFGKKIYFLLVENFPATYYTGGTVRDFLLGLKTQDIDIATSAIPSQVARKLSSAGVSLDNSHTRFGVVIARAGKLQVEITTLRKDINTKSRYPKVVFTKTPKVDSNRRDFTINTLYLSLKSRKILDFHDGRSDLEKKLIRFVGSPEKRISEDPLRIVRAYRFALELNFSLERETRLALKKNIDKLSLITKSRLTKEVGKLKNKKLRKQLLSQLVHK